VLAPNYFVSLKDTVAFLINSSLTGYSKNILKVKDIKILANADLSK
jgi:hypothetical protein